MATGACQSTSFVALHPSVLLLRPCRGLQELVAPTLWQDKGSQLKMSELFQRRQHTEVGRPWLTKSSSSHWAVQQEEITKQETSAGSDQLFCSLTSKWSLPGVMIFHFLPVSAAYLWESDFTVIFGRWTSLFLLLHTPLCCCQTLSPLPACWSSPKQREWSVRKPRDLSDSASFGLSLKRETNVISPSTPYQWGPCVQVRHVELDFPIVGKELNL